MPRWASWATSGLALVALGVLVTLIGYQQPSSGIGTLFAGQAIAAAGMWVLVVAAVILGSRIANDPIEKRLRKIERGLDRLRNPADRDQP